MEESSTEIDPRNVGSDMIRQPPVTDGCFRFPTQFRRLLVDTSDEGTPREYSDSGRVVEEVMQTDGSDDLHSP